MNKIYSESLRRSLAPSLCPLSALETRLTVHSVNPGLRQELLQSRHDEREVRGQQ